MTQWSDKELGTKKIMIFVCCLTSAWGSELTTGAAPPAGSRTTRAQRSAGHAGSRVTLASGIPIGRMCGGGWKVQLRELHSVHHRPSCESLPTVHLIRTHITERIRQRWARECPSRGALSARQGKWMETTQRASSFHHHHRLFCLLYSVCVLMLIKKNKSLAPSERAGRTHAQPGPVIEHFLLSTFAEYMSPVSCARRLQSLSSEFSQLS